MEGGSGPLPMSTGIATLRNVMQKYMYVVYMHMHMYVYMQFKFSLEDAIQRGTKEQLIQHPFFSMVEYAKTVGQPLQILTTS